MKRNKTKSNADTNQRPVDISLYGFLPLEYQHYTVYMRTHWRIQRG